MPNDTSASKEAATIPFILSTGLQKPDQDTRKFIRKHVMLGKNAGKGSGKHRDIKGKRRRPPEFIPRAIAPRPEEDDDSVFTDTLPLDCPSSIPQRIGTDVSLVKFADGVEPSTASLVLQFSAVAKQTLFPLESCILFDKQEGRQWIELMAFDPVFMHTIIFTTLAYHDSLLGRQCFVSTNVQLSLHFTKALHLLRNRLKLENDETKFSDITMSIVLGLAVYAYLTGERKAAEYHLSALRIIIDFRGGLMVFWHNEKLLLELFRCDIGLALDNGTTTFFFNDPLVEPFLPYPEEESLHGLLGANLSDTQVTQDNKDIFLDEVDNDLAKTWSVVKQFSWRINFANENKSKLPKELLLDTMASVSYRLLYMTFRHGSLDEYVRLGLLAYSSTIFLQWRDTRMSYHRFSIAYRDSLTAFHFSDMLPIHFRLWLLMTGAVSIFKEHDHQWLKPQLLSITNSCGLKRWGQVRNILYSLMWIDLLHDRLGKRFFDSVVNDGSSVGCVHDGL